MDLHAVLEIVRAKTGANSERALGRALGMSAPGVRHLLQGHGYPSDEVMLRIAALANIPDDEALLLLNMWRSKGRATAIYGKLHKRLIKPASPPKQRNRRAGRKGEQIAQSSA